MTDRSGSYKCSVCSFDLWLPIATLNVSSLGLNNDARFPGRCLLILHEHLEDFADMDSELASAFVADAQLAAQAIKTATNSPRINYAILGNREPHVHFHLIPRMQTTDPIPGKAPWEHPQGKTNLEEVEVVRIMSNIRTALESLTHCNF